MANSQGSNKNAQRVTLSSIVATVILAIIVVAQFLAGGDGTGDDTPTQAPTLPPLPTLDATAVAGLEPLQPIPGGYDGGWFQVYFTDPINRDALRTDASVFRGAPIENALVGLIDSATQTIDAALFELNSEPVTQALVRAAERNVRVRVVTDGEHGLEAPDSTVFDLELADIAIVSDGDRTSFMHNKFFVVDGLYVWTGSTNITINGLYNNNNNAILLRSRQLAQNFTAEFDELFGGSFGVTSADVVPNPVITVNQTRVETYFEAEGSAPERLAELFQNARTVRFMAFSFTDSLEYETASGERSLMGLFVSRAQTGNLGVMGIVEASSRRFIEDLFCAGLQVRQDGNPDVLHHKVFIIDDSIVATGSFNFSRNAATSNDENMLIIHDPRVAQVYLDEFFRRWQEAEQIPASAFGC